MEFVGFDIETTGTLSHVDHIVEIAGTRFKDGRPVASYQSLVSLEGSMPKEASAVNGITDDMLKGQPPVAEVLDQFADFCGDSVMAAHNAPFDFQFIARAVQDHRTQAPGGPVLDTCNLARKAFPGQINYKLSTLCAHLKIKPGRFHRAAADAMACGCLFHLILEKLPYNTLEEVIRFSGKKPLKFPEPYEQGQLSFF